eukprot:5457988-Pleurochrysis_carterae.AAC.1
MRRLHHGQRHHPSHSRFHFVPTFISRSPDPCGHRWTVCANASHRLPISTGSRRRPHALQGCALPQE